GQRGEVDLRLVLRPLPEGVDGPVEVETGPAAGHRDEELAEARHHGPRGGTGDRGVDREVAPPEDGDVLLGGELLDPAERLFTLLFVDGEKGDARGVRTLRRKREIHDGAEEGVRDLGQDARAVTGLRLAPARTTVV